MTDANLHSYLRSVRACHTVLVWNTDHRSGYWLDPTGCSCFAHTPGRGIGIPKHQQAQIFGRFIRADNTQAWGISGPGLYLCRKLVERQGR